MQPGAACAEMLLVGWGCENFVLNVNANSNVNGCMVVHGALAKRLWCGLVWRWRPKPHPNRGAGAPKSNQIKSWRWRPKSKSFMALAPPNQNQITSLIWAGAPNQNHSWRWRPKIKSNQIVKTMIFTPMLANYKPHRKD